MRAVGLRLLSKCSAVAAFLGRRVRAHAQDGDAGANRKIWWAATSGMPGLSAAPSALASALIRNVGQGERPRTNRRRSLGQDGQARARVIVWRWIVENEKERLR